MKHILTALLFAPLAALDAAEPPATFCNPLPISNYPIDPIGRFARNVKNGEPDLHGHWKLGYEEQFRELADPSVLWFDGKWYLYPSADMAWVSADNGGSWQHHPLKVRDIGYAPTVKRHRGRFLLLASQCNPVFPALRYNSMALSGASRRINSSSQ